MLYSGTDPESYITDHTSVYEDYWMTLGEGGGAHLMSARDPGSPSKANGA